MFYGFPESGQTLVADFMETAEIAFGQISLPGRESCFRATSSPHDSVYHERE